VDVLLDVANDLGGVDACRIVGAVKNGPAGVKTINHTFHALLTSGKRCIHGYAVGEPVIWLRNNADIGLLNGSLGGRGSGRQRTSNRMGGRGRKGH